MIWLLVDIQGKVEKGEGKNKENDFLPFWLFSRV